MVEIEDQELVFVKSALRIAAVMTDNEALKHYFVRTYNDIQREQLGETSHRDMNQLNEMLNTNAGEDGKLWTNADVTVEEAVKDDSSFVDIEIE